MSLILDALKRSRSEESAVPGVDTYHAPLDAPPAWRAYLPWVGLVIALVVVAWLLLERTGLLSGERAEAEGEQATPAQVARPQASASPAAPRPAVEAAPQPKPRPAPAPGASRPSVPASSAPAVAADAGEPTDAAVAELYRARGEQLQEEASAPSRVQREPAVANRQAVREEEEQPLDLESMLQEARDELEAGEFVDHPAPFITSLSQQTRDPIPTILYQRHEYSGQSGRASVVMNGKTLRAGGSPAAGVKLEEILPNSAVLSYRGTQFRLRALNSWVNL